MDNASGMVGRGGDGSNVIDFAPAASELKIKAEAWRRALRDADCGPLVIAADVMGIADEWDTWRKEAGDVDCSAWLRKTFGNGWDLGRFKRLHRAVLTLGEACRRTYNHHTAVYISRQVPADKLDDVKREMRKAYKANGSNPLSLQQAKAIVSVVVGKKPSKKTATCHKCEVYRQFILDHGMVPPEVE